MKSVLKKMVAAVIAIILVFGSIDTSSAIVYGVEKKSSPILSYDEMNDDEDTTLLPGDTDQPEEETTAPPVEPDEPEEGSTVTPVEPEEGSTATSVDPERPNGIGIHFVNSDETIVEGEIKQLEVVRGLPRMAAEPESISYSSSDDDVVYVDDTGCIEGISEGEAVITATSASGLITTCNIIVVMPPVLLWITFAHKEMVIQVGKEFQVGVVGVPAKAVIGKINYKSDDTSIATISSTGVIKGKKAGDVMITIESDGRSSMTYVDIVDFAFTTDTISAVVGESKQLTLGDLSVPALGGEITYTTSDENIVTVSQSGKITALKNGTATITATGKAGLTATCTVNVGAASEATKLHFSVENITVLVGQSKQLIVKQGTSNETPAELTYSSSDNNIATVSTSGVVTGIKPGTVTITMENALGLMASCSVKVQEPSKITEIFFSPSKVNLMVGTKKDLVLKQEPSSEIPEKITYISSNKKIATVNSAGRVTAVKSGTAIITAKSDSGHTSKAQVTVTPKVKLSKTNLSLNYGQKAVLKITGTASAVTWKTSNKKIVTVKKGQVTSVGVGTAKVSAKVGGKTYICSVTVKKPVINVKNKNLKVKQYVQLKVNTSKKIKWISSNSRIAYVSQNGKVTARKAGKIVITGKIDSKYVVKCIITVSAQKKGYRTKGIWVKDVMYFINMFKIK